MQHTNKGDVEGTGPWMAAWRPLNSGERQMPSERPYPGQLWKRDSTQVIIVAVHPNTITYEFLSGGQSVTRAWTPFSPSSHDKAAARIMLSSTAVHTMRPRSSTAPYSRP